MLQLFNLHPTVSSILEFFGLIWAIGFLLTILQALWTLARPSKLAGFGRWAAVTGATDGIGFAYSKELAKNGFNIVLISRTQARLDEKKQELKKAYPNIDVETIQADFDSASLDYSKIEEALKKIPLGILVNNVGRSYDHAEFFDALSSEQVQSLLRMNIEATTKMTHIVLPGMLERKKGAIVNIGSAAGSLHCGDPLYAVYSATKAYVDFFSRSLHYEYKRKGVHVQCQIPYFVPTKLSKIRKASFGVPDSQDWAASAVQRIGYEASVVPYPVHALQHFLFQKVLPGFVFIPLLLKHHFGIRSRAYKKKQN